MTARRVVKYSLISAVAFVLIGLPIWMILVNAAKPFQEAQNPGFGLPHHWALIANFREVIDQGAAEVAAYVTHGVLSGAATERVQNSVLKELVVTDSIEASTQSNDSGKIRRISVAPLIGEAIRRIANEESVSKLFD